MSSLPLLFKKEGLVQRHQIEGMDPSARSFNRAILVSRTGGGYKAKLTYEALPVEGREFSTVTEAVKDVVEKLKCLGFLKMRTRANFKGNRYLAEKETWLDYSDLL